MTLHHHPSDETLMRLAAGTLGAGPALVVTVHLEGCAICRNRLANFEAIGGAILDAMPPVPLAVDLFGRTMERLDLVEPVRPKERMKISHPKLGIELPRAMHYCEIGPWRWLGPGFKWSSVRIPGSPDEKVMLLRGRAGLNLPAHGHIGLEYMQVLLGSLSDQRGRYCPGDLDEAGDDVDHRPVVGEESDCICLAAVEGDTRLHGLLGRLLRPLVGF